MLIFSRRLPFSAVVFIYSMVGLVSFWPILGKDFSSDDFQVIDRVVFNKVFVPAGFFRPLSDISFYLNYLVGGFEPAVYFVFNFVVHLLSTILLYRFCIRLAFLFSVEGKFFPFVAGLLFLIYPFHNEALAWAVGRGASMAAFFSIAAMNIVLGKGSNFTRTWAASLCYFLAISAYESAMPLPVILCILSGMRKEQGVALTGLAIGLSISLVGHFALRYVLSGSVLGEYASGIFSLAFPGYLAHGFKAFGRLFLPPTNNSTLFVILTTAVLALLMWQLFRKAISAGTKWWRNPWIATGIFLMSSMLICIVFPVSTKTSESDRLLYFPSVFASIFIAMILAKKQQSQPRFSVLLILLLVFLSEYFLQLNHMNWRRASEITRSLVGIAKSKPANGTMYFINIPGEYNGAYVFRHGFKEALHINNLDTSMHVMVNLFDKEEMRTSPPVIEAFTSDQQTDIYPGVEVYRDAEGKTGWIRHQQTQYNISPSDHIWYWNKYAFVKLF